MRHGRLIFIALIALAALGWQSQSAQATHTSGPYGPLPHVDQISIDVGPPGVNVGVEGNGKPAVGDRDFNGVPDAEGYDTSWPGDAPGLCGNGMDDDQADPNGDTVPGPGGFDGIADDGCQVTLTPLETCAEIIDDGILNADEDALVSGQDRLTLDITTGAHPGSSPGSPGGIPTPLNVAAWQLDFNWAPDVIDADVQNIFFLILTDGGAQPFTNVSEALPQIASPFVAGVADGGLPDDGSGVLTRITVEGNTAGVATLSLSDVVIYGYPDQGPIPIDLFNSASVAVSKDGPDAGTTIGDSGGEMFQCPTPFDSDGDGVFNFADNCQFVYNSTQTDLDGDGVGDACDPDSDADGDGVQDGNDACPLLPGIPARMGCPEPAVGGIAGLLAGTDPQPASVTSDGERGQPAVALALAGGAAAIIAASLVAVRLRRRR